MKLPSKAPAVPSLPTLPISQERLQVNLERTDWEAACQVDSLVPTMVGTTRNDDLRQLKVLQDCRMKNPEHANNMMFAIGLQMY